MSNYSKKQKNVARTIAEPSDIGGPLPRRGLSLLSPEEAAAYVRKGTSSLAKLRVYGGGPAYFKVGRRVYYDITELDEWLYARRLSSTSDVGK